MLQEGRGESTYQYHLVVLKLDIFNWMRGYFTEDAPGLLYEDGALGEIEEPHKGKAIVPPLLARLFPFFQ